MLYIPVMPRCMCSLPATSDLYAQIWHSGIAGCIFCVFKDEGNGGRTRDFIVVALFAISGWLIALTEFPAARVLECQ